jgi:hypothetical protein
LGKFIGEALHHTYKTLTWLVDKLNDSTYTLVAPSVLIHLKAVKHCGKDYHDVIEDSYMHCAEVTGEKHKIWGSREQGAENQRRQ